jgi:hypothetical protein
VIEIDDVLVARMQSGRVISARSLKSFFLSSAFSVTASMTRSQSFSADRLVAEERFFFTASICSSVTFPRFLPFSRKS